MVGSVPTLLLLFFYCWFVATVNVGKDNEDQTSVTRCGTNSQPSLSASKEDDAFVQTWAPRAWLRRSMARKLPPFEKPHIYHSAYDEQENNVILFGQQLLSTVALEKKEGGVLRCAWEVVDQDNGVKLKRWILSDVIKKDILDHSVPCLLPRPYPCLSKNQNPKRRYCTSGRVTLLLQRKNETTHGIYAVPSTAFIPRVFTKTKQTQQPRHAVCAVTIVKNEEPFIREYVDYHWLLGISFFLFFENNSTDGTLTAITSMAHKGAHALYWPFKKSQAAAYVLAYLATRHLCKYTLFMDMDQFISLGPAYPPSLPLSLERAFYLQTQDDPSASQLCLFSLEFQSSGLIRRPKASVVSTYRYRLPNKSVLPNCAVIGQVKGGIKLDSRIHWFMDGAGYHRKVLPVDWAVFNHYKNKSWEDYTRKYDGRIGLVYDWEIPPGGISVDLPFSDWARYGSTGVFDESVVEFRDTLYRECSTSIVF